MQAMKEVSRVWLVGKMVYTLFESIIGNKMLEERLQKAGGKRHRKVQQGLSKLEQHSKSQQEASKRKYDDMSIDFTANAPTPQESYERSRPQSPSLVKSEHTPTMQPPMVASPPTRPNAADAFMGGTSSRPQTRPATPFNPSFSVPGTPPDLYLVTRNSPNLSQSLWENFQPDQLFPENSSMPFISNRSPPQTHQDLNHNMATQMPPSGLNPAQSGGSMQNFQSAPANLWQTNFDSGMPDVQSPDSWSTGSMTGQPAPTTLNVEDWYAVRFFNPCSPANACIRLPMLTQISRFQFFGINGDASNLNLDVSLN